MTEDPKRPTLFAPCSLELLEAVRARAGDRDMTVAGLIRQAVAKHLGLPAEFVTKPAKTGSPKTKSKKELARRNGRG